MNRKIMPFMLFIIEVIMYYFICLYFHMDIDLIVGSGILYFLFLFIYGHYSLSTCLIWDEIRALVKSSFCFYIALLVLVPRSTGYDRRMHLTIMVGAMFFICLLADRYIRIAFRDQFARRTLVIGTGYEAARLGKISNNNRFALTKVEGYVDANWTNQLYDFKQENIIKNSFLYSYEELDEAIEKLKIEQIIVALPEANEQVIDKVMSDIYGKVETIKYLPDVNGTMTFSSEVQDFDGQLLIATANSEMSALANILKRLIDICAGVAGCLTLLPLMAFVKYKYVKSGDFDNIMFSQNRIGKNGKMIKIYKFRSMVPNAEKILEDLMKKDPKIKEEYLTNKKLVNDPRITPVGKFLRKTSLDELPQIVNIIKGDLSIIGPRPVIEEELEKYGENKEKFLSVTPGLTGYWQANGRSSTTYEQRMEMELYYIDHISPKLDFKIFFKTIESVIKKEGAI